MKLLLRLRSLTEPERENKFETGPVSDLIDLRTRAVLAVPNSLCLTNSPLTSLGELMTIQMRISTRLVLLAILAVLAFQAGALAQDKVRKIDELVSLYNKYGEFNGSALVAENGQVI